MDKKELMKEELKILFDTLCDGLRQEVRQRRLANLVTGQDFSIPYNEREIGIASSLALHLRSVGFAVQLDAYFPSGPSQRRPDFGIWLPASKQYIYLELKQIAWGDLSRQYDYQRAIDDVQKLVNETDPQNQQNGLIALGFSKPNELRNKLTDGFDKSLAQRIDRDYPHYEEIGRECIELEGMDKHSSYAIIGMWFRKP